MVTMRLSRFVLKLMPPFDGQGATAQACPSPCRRDGNALRMGPSRAPTDTCVLWQEPRSREEIAGLRCGRGCGASGLQRYPGFEAGTAAAVAAAKRRCGGRVEDGAWGLNLPLRWSIRFPSGTDRANIPPRCARQFLLALAGPASPPSPPPVAQKNTVPTERWSNEKIWYSGTVPVGRCLWHPLDGRRRCTTPAWSPAIAGNAVVKYRVRARDRSGGHAWPRATDVYGGEGRNSDWGLYQFSSRRAASCWSAATRESIYRHSYSGQPTTCTALEVAKRGSRCWPETGWHKGAAGHVLTRRRQSGVCAGQQPLGVRLGAGACCKSDSSSGVRLGAGACATDHGWPVGNERDQWGFGLGV